MSNRDGNNEAKDERQGTRDLKTWRNTLCLNREAQTQTQMERGTGRVENKETETLRQKDRRMYRDRQGSMIQRDSDFDKDAVTGMSIQQERGDTESRCKR